MKVKGTEFVHITLNWHGISKISKCSVIHLTSLKKLYFFIPICPTLECSRDAPASRTVEREKLSGFCRIHVFSLTKAIHQNVADTMIPCSANSNIPAIIEPQEELLKLPALKEIINPERKPNIAPATTVTT
jgi:hypothetical protein